MVEPTNLNPAFCNALATIMEITGEAGDPTDATFDDLGFCVGSGKGDGGTGVGGDEDTPGNDPIPIPPDGSWPPPPVPLILPFGNSNIPVTGMAYWNATQVHFTVKSAINLINAAAANNAMILVTMGPENGWRPGGTVSLAAWKAQLQALYDNPAIRAAMETAIANGVLFCHYVIDEPFHPRRWGTRPWTFTEVEQMCVFSKTLFENWRTMIRVSPTDPRYLRKMVGLDTMWAEYHTERGDIHRFRDERIAKILEYEHDLIFGLHYLDFHGVGTRAVITAAELDFYGNILWGTSKVLGPKSRIVGAFGWKYDTGFDTADRWAALRRRCD